jgi:hypothetical protein
LDELRAQRPFQRGTHAGLVFDRVYDTTQEIGVGYDGRKRGWKLRDGERESARHPGEHTALECIIAVFLGFDAGSRLRAARVVARARCVRFFPVDDHGQACGWTAYFQ